PSGRPGRFQKKLAEGLRHLGLAVVAGGQFMIRPAFPPRTSREWVENRFRGIVRFHARNVGARKGVCRVGRRVNRLLETPDRKIAQTLLDELARRTLLESPQID